MTRNIMTDMAYRDLTRIEVAEIEREMRFQYLSFSLSSPIQRGE